MENNNNKSSNTEGEAVDSSIALELLSPAIGSRHRRKRIARGESSGHGKTAGRGNKGQKSRSGASIPAWFEGGQMPLYRRVGKIGFRSQGKTLGSNQYRTIDLDFLNTFDAGTTVNLETLASKGVTAGAKCGAGIKVLGDGELTKKLTVELQAFSQSAKQKIEAAGGTASVVASSSVSTSTVEG